MPVQQTFIVRRGGAERFRALQDTFGAAPLSATITWDRRERDRRRRRRAQVSPSARRRAERRGLEPSSWSALDFLVTGRPGGNPPSTGLARPRFRRTRSTAICWCFVRRA